ncbi:hypothetical protein G6514_006440 [Epicoccum nigrum]|nr:hypothetical protein G6514_006440 [Epicoccum nigrum]
MYRPEHFAPERDDLQQPRSHPPPGTRADWAPAPDFLIIGLFALRLTHRLVSSLRPYPEQGDDLSWLDRFLAPYSGSYDLAVLRGSAKEEYRDVYQRVVGRMKKQWDFPLVFMEANPLPRMFGVRRDGSRGEGRRRDESREREEISDAQRREAIDFVHAAAEWGSVVLLPEKEAERMMMLAERRRLADLERDHADDRKSRRGDGGGGGGGGAGERVRTTPPGWTKPGALPHSFGHGSLSKRDVRFAPDGRG